MEAVTAILIDRERAAHGLSRMVAWSVALHLVVGAGVVLGAGRLFGGPPAPAARVVMNVTLGGAPGPDTGGANPLGGRPVQQVAPTPEARPQPLRTPAAK